MVAISRNKVRIWIVADGTNGSALAATGLIEGEIKSYNKSGGDKDVESDPVFGGFVDKEKPRNQVEVSFEIVPAIGTSSTRWEEIAYKVDTTNAGVYTMAEDPDQRTVYIQALNGSDYMTYGFNNCSVTMYDIEHNADDNRTGNLTLKFSPTNESGVSNFMAAALAATALPAWTALDNNS